MGSQSQLAGLVLGLSIVCTPSVFAGDSVGEIIRDAVTLPLILPHVALEALAHSHSREVVVERHYHPDHHHHRPDYRPYYRRPASWHPHRRHHGHPDYSRPYSPPDESKPPYGGHRGGGRHHRD